MLPLRDLQDDTEHEELQGLREEALLQRSQTLQQLSIFKLTLRVASTISVLGLTAATPSEVATLEGQVTYK
ncbi:hypothetical protein P7K49_011558 [Saguinus oedipus]|uniref:Uncharacterized protein n=1 Tax=Saguinus oedipus TaxID=9490 RepID=A0ABQ9VQZ6_SAGOE|nr:hypothetical protein P7K49_011558 [Saguinus oedipus]